MQPGNGFVQALENRTLDSKREMDIMNALDEMKSLKSRQERVDSEALLSALKRSGDDEELILDEEDEAAVRMNIAAASGVLGVCGGAKMQPTTMRTFPVASDAIARQCWNVELGAVLSVQVRAMLMQQQKFVRRLDDDGVVQASANQASGEDVALQTNGEGTAARVPGSVAEGWPGSSVPCLPALLCSISW